MKRISLFLIALCFCSVSVFAQTEAEKRYDKERFEERANEIKAKMVSDISTELELDAFEKEIVSQTILSYFDEVQRIYVMNVDVNDKRALLDLLDKKHFNDLKNILSEEEVDFILDQIKGDWKKNQKELEKKRKKNKKKKKNN
ncbi:MAG: hypothetical protein HRU26_15710 [Psychroserpens sp.]|nr:hypothetical protein [Psychroserpens sp.]